MNASDQRSSPAPARGRRRGVIALIAAALAVAAFVRFDRLGEQDYWLDELHSMANSAGRRGELESVPHGVILRNLPRFTDLTRESGLGTVWRTMARDSHPPLYFELLYLWRRIVGDGAFAVRSLAAACSILAIVPIAAALSVLGERRLVPWIVLGLSISFSHVHMAQENRPYSLGMLLVALGFYLLVRMERDWPSASTWRRIVLSILYGASAYLATMTHYFTAFPLAAQGVYVLIRFRGHLMWSWVAAVLMAGSVWTVTWGGVFAGQLDFIAGQDWLLEQRPDHAMRTLMRITDLPLRLLFHHERFSFSALRSLGGAGMWIALLAATLRRRSAADTLFALWFVLPVAALALIDAMTQRQLLSHIRYTSIAVSGLIGLIVLGIAQLPRAPRWGAAIALIAVAAMTLPVPTQSNPQSKRAAALITDEIAARDLLVYDAIGWPPFWASRLYLIVSYALPDPKPPFVLLRDPPSQGLRAQMASFDRIVVVSPRVEEIPNPDPERFEHVGQTGYIFGVGIIHLFARRAALSQRHRHESPGGHDATASPLFKGDTKGARACHGFVSDGHAAVPQRRPNPFRESVGS